MSFNQYDSNLLQKVAALSERAHRQDCYSIEQKIAEAEREARLAEEVMANAIAEANGNDAAKALRFRDEALAKIRELSAERDTLKCNQFHQWIPPLNQSPLKTLQTSDYQITAPEAEPDDEIQFDDLLDDRAIAQHQAYKWLDQNEWYTEASPTQKLILESLHRTLRVKGLKIETDEYWLALSGLVKHLGLANFEEPMAKKELSAQERILNLLETIAVEITCEIKNAQKAPKKAAKDAVETKEASAPAVEPKPATKRIRKKAAPKE